MRGLIKILSVSAAIALIIWFNVNMVNAAQKNAFDTFSPDSAAVSQDENNATTNEKLEVFTGNNLILGQNKAAIYPNPAIDNLSVVMNSNNLGIIEITLYNSIGNKVFETSVNDRKNVYLTINLESYQRGLYFIEFKSGNQKVLKKIILK